MSRSSRREDLVRKVIELERRGGPRQRIAHVLGVTMDSVLRILARYPQDKSRAELIEHRKRMGR